MKTFTDLREFIVSTHPLKDHLESIQAEGKRF